MIRRLYILVSIIFLLGCADQMPEMVDTDVLAEAKALHQETPQKALDILIPFIRHAELQDDHRNAAEGHYLASLAYFYLGNSSQEYEALAKAQYHAEQMDDKLLLTKVYGDISAFYFGKGLWKRAIEFGSLAFELKEDHGTSHEYKKYMLFCLSGALTYVNEHEKALLVLESMEGGSIRNQISQLEWMSFNLYKLDRVDEAEEIAEACLTLAEKNGISHNPDILNTVGLIYQYRGEFLNAAQYFNSAIETNPTYQQAAFNLGAVYESLHEPTKAIAAYQLLRDRMVSEESSIYTLTLVHKSLNRMQPLLMALGRSEEAHAVMMESEAMLEHRALTEAAQSELEAIYALDKLKETALLDLVKEKESQASVNRKMAVLFAGLLSLVLIGFFAWAMYFNRKKLEVHSTEVADHARDVIEFLSMHTNPVERK